MTFEKILEKQSAVLTKMYKARLNEGSIRGVYKCVERGITYYTFNYELMIPFEFENQEGIHQVKIADAKIPEFSVPRFLEQFYHFGGGLEDFRIGDIPDKKELKEMIKTAGGMRINPLFRVEYYTGDPGDFRLLNDKRYISARDLLYIYDFLCESKYDDIDIYVVPARKASPFFFKGLYGSGYIMPTIETVRGNIDESRIINK